MNDTKPDPTPTPLASTAMEAANKIAQVFQRVLADHQVLMAISQRDLDAIAGCIVEHFQPLLAKVKEKPDAKTLEGRAAIFLRETGMVAPFKDSRDGAFSQEEREEAWAEWLNKYRSSLESENMHGLHEVVRLRAELTALRADLAAAKELFERHTKAVGDFLNELYAISCDPLVDGTIEVSEIKAALLDAAKRDRDLKADLAAKEAALEWAMARMVKPTLILGQNDNHYNAWMKARSALASRADKGGAR